MTLQLHQGTREDREVLARIRAAAWKGALTETQFLERNTRLYDHEFGKKRIQTLVLKKDTGYICASMDVLSVTLLRNMGTDEPVERPGILVASVITAPQDRKSGFAT